MTAASTLASWRRRGVGARLVIAVLLSPGVALAATLPTAGAAQSVRLAQPPTGNSYAVYVAEAAQRFGIPAAWIWTVLRGESAGDARAVSSAGAMGLMQVMPDTWAALRVRYGFGRDPYDPHDNILAGAAYLREMYDRYGNVVGMLAAYNAGPARYDDYVSRGRALPAETRAYVATLAPLIDGGESSEPVMVAAADPHAWTRAPLFVAQSERTADAESMTTGKHSGDASTAVSVRDVSAIVPQSGGLFVARASIGERQ